MSLEAQSESTAMLASSDKLEGDFAKLESGSGKAIYATSAFFRLLTQHLSQAAMSYVGSSAGLTDLLWRLSSIYALAVEDELAALKKGSLKPGSDKPVAPLPEGRPVKDVFDSELEELRKKAKQ